MTTCLNKFAGILCCALSKSTVMSANTSLECVICDTGNKYAHLENNMDISSLSSSATVLINHLNLDGLSMPASVLRSTALSLRRLFSHASLVDLFTESIDASLSFLLKNLYIDVDIFRFVS